MQPSLLHSIVTAASLAIGLLVIRRRSLPGGLNLLLLAGSLSVWGMISLIVLSNESAVFDVSMGQAISSFFAGFCALQLILIALEYAKKPHWGERSTLTIFMLHPALSLLNIFNRLQAPASFSSVSDSATVLSTFFEKWGQITSIYVYSLELLVIFLMLDSMLRSTGRRMAWLASIACLVVPSLFHLETLISSNLTSFFSMSVSGFGIAEIGMTFAFFSSLSRELTSFAREFIVDQMEDGWMTVDAQSRITDINPAAERMMGISRREVFGKPITSILAEWPNFILSQEKIREFEMRKSFKRQNEWSYISTRVLQARDRHGNFSGHLILWRDITGRKLSEKARQQAREEMFVLLSSISSAANRATSRAEFLGGIGYQILQAFQSQAIATFLVQPGDQRENSVATIKLESQFGFPESVLAELTTPSILSGLMELSSHTKQAIPIDSLQHQDRLPPAIWAMGISHVAVIPLLAPSPESSNYLGYVLVARSNQRSFGQDEMVRMSIAAEHTALLIYGDRRRQTSIALTERQKLLRDLHDSVSQKLYGLVTTAEAAQAAIEAGSIVNPAAILAKIGENARQAVKEMRLFLYEMQPVELEKEGLVSVLHHRLAAVEGRADLKARLIADENLIIPKEKQIALYYITQEALNNILRHARANSILIRIWKTRKNLILQISDNGVGFAPKLVERGGLGLNNMKERTAQINGKLKIVSNAKTGTKITVTIPTTG